MKWIICTLGFHNWKWSDPFPKSGCCESLQTGTCTRCGKMKEHVVGWISHAVNFISRK
jgi:hypothetical protein